jgi:hypothetical protein
MAQPQRSWNAAPYEPNVGDVTNSWFAYVQSQLNQVEGTLFPPGQPSVTTISHPNAVQVVFDEVPYAISYAIFETSSASVPPGVPLATVPANLGGNSNSYLRASLNDTTTRYYWVQAIDKNGDRSTVSAAAPGAALSIAASVIPVSHTPVNQGGVGGGVGGGGAIPGRRANINRLA